MGPQMLAKLTTFLKNVRIKTRTTGDRTKTIRGLEVQGCHFEFEKDGRPTTVAVNTHFCYVGMHDD
jgi:hypothetical protein